MILTHLVLFSFLGGAGGAEAPPAAAETFSGGWSRHAISPFEKARAKEGPSWRRFGRTETGTEREARIHAERIKLGILPPDPEPPAEGEAPSATIEGVPATLTLVSPDPGLAPSYPRAGAGVDLAGLYAGAWLDQEIRRYFELQDDDDAAVLLLAVAALG